MILQKNKYVLLFLSYIIILVFFAMLSYKLIFHDTWEYICMAKSFAGYFNCGGFIVHSLTYPFFISLFARFFPSMLTIKLVNLSWVILIGLLLYKLESKKTAFLIWVFSPIVWLIGIQISPILPASFFLLLAYLLIKKWQENKKSPYFITSAFSLGLSAAFYDLAMVLIVLFILAFFYNRKFKEVIFYSLFTFLSFSIRLLLEASLFSLAINDKVFPFPFYSLIRFWGAITVISSGLHTMIPVSKLSLMSSLESWSFLILISPLLFFLYKTDYQKNKNIIFFLILSTLFFIFQGGGYLYFILIAPISIILLSAVFKRRDLLLHILISIFIILVMVSPYFISDRQETEKRNLIINDLQMVKKDFSFNAVVFYTNTLANFYMWDKNLPYFISPEEYGRITNNNIYYSQYTFKTRSKIGVQKTLELKAGMKAEKKEGIDYENLPWIVEEGEKPPEGYKLTKCYTLLCVYEKGYT